MKYKCQLCSYETDERHNIDAHHIIPQEEHGADEDWNIVYVCPNCHRRIYIPSATSGIHSVKNIRSIILIKKYFSTGGYILEYKDVFGKVEMVQLKNWC